MRIGILTLPIGHNYGGILQNFALQYVLRQLGHNPITFAKGETYPYRKYYGYKVLKLLRLYKDKMPLKPMWKQRRITLFRKNWEFIFDNINVTSPKIALNEDLPSRLNLDAIIVGSDQVWRPDYYWEIDTMFLSFVPENSEIKRITYGASFGGREWRFTAEQTRQCDALIKKFDKVSVRELDGIEMCRKYFGVDSVCVLDPTLLVPRHEYERLCKKLRQPDREYVCAYILDCDEEIKTRLEDIAKQRNMELKIFSADKDCTLSVEEWIAMFRDAGMVITDSFHGSVFSIIFQKEFYSIANISRGGSRFVSLLSQLGLQYRLFDSVQSLDFNIPETDWTDVGSKLNVLKQSSLDYLVNALK